MSDEAFREIKNQAHALIAEGDEVFYARVLERVFAEHGESWMNLCPNCQALCRTRRSKQCPRCFASWHREASEPCSNQKHG
jgi:hypothetical protein